MCNRLGQSARRASARGTWRDSREWTTQAKADSPQNKVSVHVHYGSNCSGELLPPFEASSIQNECPLLLEPLSGNPPTAIATQRRMKSLYSALNSMQTPRLSGSRVRTSRVRFVI